MNNENTEDKGRTELRKSTRVNCVSLILCTKSIYNGETVLYREPLELTLLNVSPGGLGIISDKLFEKGSILSLDMKLEDISYQKIAARVIWNIKKGEAYRHGLEIVNISGTLYRHLSRLDNSVMTRI